MIPMLMPIPLGGGLSPRAALILLIILVTTPIWLMPAIAGGFDGADYWNCKNESMKSLWFPGTSKIARFEQAMPTYWLFYNLAKPAEDNSGL